MTYVFKRVIWLEELTLGQKKAWSWGEQLGELECEARVEIV